MSAAEDNLGVKPVVASTVRAWRYHQHGWHCFVCWYCVVRSAGLRHRLDADGLSDHGGNDDTGFGRYGRVPVPDGGGNGDHWHDCAADSCDSGIYFHH